jgi:hypothetical protein
LRRFTSLAIACAVLSLFAMSLSGCAPNVPPTIVSLESHARVVAPGDSVLVECVATDEDGDELTFEWTSDRGAINGHAGVVAWTAPADEGIARISVTVSDGGDQPASENVAVVVKSNYPPVIDGVTAELDWVQPGVSVPIHCQAEDPDGDELSFTWTADCGQITGDGPDVTWTAPEAEGNCVITVIADDGFEGRAKGTIALVTSLYEPLLVTAMTVTAVDPPFYMVARTDWYKVYWEDSYVIECFVSEPERIVSYEWSDGVSVVTFPVGAENIVFEGGPTKIRWTAPKERGEVMITVTAKDAVGNQATKSIPMNVESCTCAFPKPESGGESKD